MNEASLKVLRMVADGKLSAEQANELLSVLGDERQPPAVDEPTEERATPADHNTRSVARDIDDLIVMKSMGIDDHFIDEMQAAGLDELDPDQLVGLKSVGVSADYIAELRAAGLAIRDSDQLVALKSMGIDAAFIHELHEAGYTQLDPDQLIDMKSVGLDAQDIAGLRARSGSRRRYA